MAEITKTAKQTRKKSVAWRVRPGEQRILLLIGQPADAGSETALDAVREQVEQENLSVYALALPELGKAFVSDPFTLDGLTRERGGFKAGADLKNLVKVLERGSAASAAADPFSVLTAASGGTQIRFRKQAEIEGGLAAIGLQVRSAYTLRSNDDDFAQPGVLVRDVFTDDQRSKLVDQVAGSLLAGVREPVLGRAFHYWRNIDADIGRRIEEKVRADGAARRGQRLQRPSTRRRHHPRARRCR